MTLTQELIEHDRKCVALKACAVVLYDRAYDLAMGKDRK